MRAGLIIFLSAIAMAGLVPASSLAADADLGVTNLASEATTQDADLTYAITVQNGGPDAAADVTLTNDVPAGTRFVSLNQDSAWSCATPAVGGTGTVACTVPTLAPGAVKLFTLTVHVDPGTPRGDFITDQAHVASTVFDPNEENDTSTQSSLVGPVTSADVGVTMLVPEVAAPNTDVTSAITVQNGGPDTADATTLTVTPPPGSMTFVSLEQTSGPAFSCATPAVGTPGGTITCDNASFAAGATATFTLVMHVPGATPSGEEELNFAAVTTTAHDPNAENDSATSTTTIGDANVAATASGPASVVAGETISYTLNVANAGPDPADAAVLSDTLPAHTRFVSLAQTSGGPFVLTTPAAGATGTVTASRSLMAAASDAAFTLVVGVDADTPATTIVNTATVSATTADPDPADNSATVSTMASAIPGPPVLAPPSPAVAAAPAATPAPAGRRLVCGRVPDLRRHTLRGARFILARDHCDVGFRHLGRARRPPSHVLRQSVKPGTPLYVGDVLIVRLR